MPSLIREESQEVTAAPPPQQQTAAVCPEQNNNAKTKKSEKRKQSPVHHGRGNKQRSTATQKKKTKTQKKEKDPNAPKQPRSTYILYTMHARPKIAATGAAVTGELLGEQWRALSAEEKLQYEQMAIDDRKRYIREKAAYDAKNKLLAESDKQQLVGGGGATASLSHHPIKSEQKNSALTHTKGDENVPNDKMECVELTEVANTDVVGTKKEANATTNKDVPSPSQKSPESIEVDLLMDSREKDELSSIGENEMAVNNGNKENNNSASSKVGKGLKGLGKSVARAKFGVPQLITVKNDSQEQEEENSSKPQMADPAGSHTGVAMNNKGSEVTLNDAKVDEKVDLGGDSCEGARGSMTVGDKKVSYISTFEVCLLNGTLFHLILFIQSCDLFIG